MKRLMRNRLACAALVLLGAVYLAFLAADLFLPGTGLLSGALKYAGILLCFAIALLLHRNAWNRRDSALLVSALFFTAAADLFLLLLNRPVAGLLFFCAVHLIYIRRYRPALFIPAAAVVSAMAAACLAAALLMPGFPVKVALACIYGALLLAVAACSIFSTLPQANRRLAVAGMALFLLCDIHVALFNAIAPDNPYYPYASFFMWLFYLPAQAALAISGYDYRGQAADFTRGSQNRPRWQYLRKHGPVGQRKGTRGADGQPVGGRLVAGRAVRSGTQTATGSSRCGRLPDQIIRKLAMSSLTYNSAKVVVAMIPLLLIYPFLQKYFVVGIVLGAVKE